MSNKNFWNFAKKDGGAELVLYGDISSQSWWGDEVTPKQFDADLKALGDVSEITVRINSSGGDVFAANAIYARLKDHGARIVVKIDGWAASAATIVAMAGDVIEIPANGIFMIHDPKLGVLGYFAAEDFEKMSEELKVVKQAIINGYALKTGKDADEISALMSRETWYDGNEAVESGFCDALMFGEVDARAVDAAKVVVNATTFDISMYKNAPKLLNHGGKPPNDFTNTNNHKEDEEMPEIKTAKDLMENYPEQAKELAKAAADAERKRIMDIEDVALAGFDEIVKDAKFGNPISAAETAMKIVAKQKEQGEQYLASRDEDAKNANCGAAQGTEGIGNDVDVYGAVIDKLLPAER